MAHDSDVLQIAVFSNVDEHASLAMHVAESQVNEYLRQYPADRVHSIQAQTETFVDPKWDEVDGAALVTRYTVTVVLRS